MIDRVIRCSVIGALQLLLALLFLQMGCRELPDKNIPRRLNKKPGNVTSQNNSPDHSGKTTPQSLVSESAATSEMYITIDEWEYATIETAYVYKTGYIFLEATKRSTRIARVRIGEEVKLFPGSSITSEWVRLRFEEFEGYLRGGNLCLSQLCIRKTRCGVVDYFRYADRIKVPQIQLEVRNLFPHEISGLRIFAQFFYQGEFIGKDESYVALDTSGLKPLSPGESRKTQMRPYYELAETDVLSPENPVEVELQCAIERFNYVKCGEFKIDRVLY